MAVKLYNFSRYSDEVLLPLLTSAKMLAGATGDVIVKVTRGGYRVRSKAQSAAFVRRFALSARAYTKTSARTELKRGWVKTDGGWVVMQPIKMSDSLSAAERFFWTAVHEFAHIVQFQTGKTLNGSPLVNSKFSHGPNGRRPNWEHRAEEIDAVNRTDEARERLQRQPERKARIENEVIALALEVDRPASDRVGEKEKA